MINLKKYLEVNGEENRFEIPGSFVEKVVFEFLTRFFTKLSFLNNLYVDDRNHSQLYWRNLTVKLKEHFGVNVYFFNYYFFGKFLHYTVNVKSEEMYGHGQSYTNKYIAYSKAIGEFLERFFLNEVGLNAKRQTRFLSIKEIKKNAALISDFHDYSNKQYDKCGYVRFTEDNVLDCIGVEDLVREKKVMYPLGYIYRSSKGFKYKRISGLTTSGCSGYFDRNTAIINAIYESVERDGFFCHWLTLTNMNKIVFKQGEVELYDKQKTFFQSLNFELDIYDTTTDLGIPSCVCVVVNNLTGGVVVSGGADLDYKKAVEKAVAESSSTAMLFANGDKDEEYVPGDAFVDSTVDRKKRLNIAKSGKFKDDFGLFSENSVPFSDVYPKPIDFINKNEELKTLVRKFKEKGDGYDCVYVYEVNETLLKSFGFHVVRAIIPKLFPLYLIESAALIESERLRDFALFKHGTRSFTLNTFPHPFP